MEQFADIHIHLLPGVDDGAKDDAESRAMLLQAYQDGTRVLCLTPHFHPVFFGDNREAVQTQYERLRILVKQDYPDLRLALGNELRYSPNCFEWLEKGYCLTLNGTDKVLVDFSEHVERRLVIDAVFRLMNAGYIPVLAHVERYVNLHRDFREILYAKQSGALIQVDADSLFGGWGLLAKSRSRRLLERGLVDLVCSDAHDTRSRTPQLSAAYTYTAERCGMQYADEIFHFNALKVLEIEG